MINIPRYLYHYQPAKTSEDLERLRCVVETRKIYCSNPTHFNDPWDCKPWFDTDPLHNSERRQQQVDFLRNVKGNQIPELMLREMAANPNLSTSVSEAVVLGLHEIIAQRYRIFCLSLSATNNLMWSHYSKDHTGVCLQFGTWNDVFEKVQKVSYSTVLPTLNMATAEKEGQKLLLTKSIDWAYEEEYRLICGTGNDILPLWEQLSLKSDGKNYLSFPPRALKAVIVGCQGDVDAVNTVSRQT